MINSVLMVPWTLSEGGVTSYPFLPETNTLHCYILIAVCVQPGVL